MDQHNYLFLQFCLHLVEWGKVLFGQNSYFPTDFTGQRQRIRDCLFLFCFVLFLFFAFVFCFFFLWVWLKQIFQHWPSYRNTLIVAKFGNFRFFRDLRWKSLLAFLIICLLMILNRSAYENVFLEHIFFVKKRQRKFNDSMFTAKCDRYRQT